MGLPRSKYVRDGQEGVYHCFSRCVRRAFLCGLDALTGHDFSHRKAWLVDRLRYLAAIFAVDVCAFAVMINHYHTILRLRPDIVASWSDWEVATRWLKLFPPRRRSGSKPASATEEEIRALTQCPARIAMLRKRLCSLSWFMGRLNEFIARTANKEDDVKGRFWESRFKCQALLDDAAIAACMVYVDLNPIRAGIASTPEESDFTSIQERIRAWQRETSAKGTVPDKAPLGNPSSFLDGDVAKLEDSQAVASAVFAGIPANPSDPIILSSDWLCQIQSDSQRRGILQMTEAQYIDLVDRSGRILKTKNQAAIDPNLAPILMRIGANPPAWPETIAHFGSKFRLAVGLLPNLRNFAAQLSRRWLIGVTAAQAAFASSPPPMA